jgi:hypothetical protein
MDSGKYYLFLVFFLCIYIYYIWEPSKSASVKTASNEIQKPHFGQRQHTRNQNSKFSAILPCVCRLYGETIATYYENVHRWQTWKMERNKRNIWHPFHFGKIAGIS